MRASLSKSGDTPTVSTVNLWLLAIDAHDALVRRLGRVLRRPALCTDEIKMCPSFPLIQLHVMYVAIVKKLICTQLLVCAQALAVEALVGAEQKILLHNLHREVRHLYHRRHFPSRRDPRKGRQASIGVTNIGWQVLFLSRRRRTGDLCLGGREPKMVRGEFNQVIPGHSAGVGDLKTPAHNIFAVGKKVTTTQKQMMASDRENKTSPAKSSKLRHFHPLQLTERRRRRTRTHSDTIQSLVKVKVTIQR